MNELVAMAGLAISAIIPTVAAAKYWRYLDRWEQVVTLAVGIVIGAGFSVVRVFDGSLFSSLAPAFLATLGTFFLPVLLLTFLAARHLDDLYRGKRLAINDLHGILFEAWFERNVGSIDEHHAFLKEAADRAKAHGNAETHPEGFAEVMHALTRH